MEGIPSETSVNSLNKFLKSLISGIDHELDNSNNTSINYQYQNSTKNQNLDLNSEASCL